MIDAIKALLPTGNRLIEPFVGGGSVFLNAGFKKNVVSDVNPKLIRMYKAVKYNAGAVIETAKYMFENGNTAAYFADIKGKFNAGYKDDIEHAAAFIYLNRHGFNGLMRCNMKGEYNVGYGKYTNPKFPDNEIAISSEILARTEIKECGFKEALEIAGKGDVVFCDPPYEPMPGKNGFTNYSGTSFKMKDQIELTESMSAAHKRGAKIVVTNSGAPAIRDLYEKAGFHVMSLPTRRSIAGKKETTEYAPDIVAVLT